MFFGKFSRCHAKVDHEVYARVHVEDSTVPTAPS